MEVACIPTHGYLDTWETEWNSAGIITRFLWVFVMFFGYWPVATFLVLSACVDLKWIEWDSKWKLRMAIWNGIGIICVALLELTIKRPVKNPGFLVLLMGVFAGVLVSNILLFRVVYKYKLYAPEYSCCLIS
eukprot:UN29798